MSKPKIILIGAGGHAHACIDVIEQHDQYQIAGLVGKSEEMHTRHFGYSVIATDDDLPQRAKDYQYALITVGQIQTPDHRMRLYQQATELGLQLPVIIAPSAHVSRHATVGSGTIVMHSAIVNYMKRAYNLLIGERTAEEIKVRLGSAFPLEEELTMEVKGRDSVAGLPKTIHITSQEIREALSDTIAAIVDAVRSTLERCPPELSADLVDRGFVMAGGGALIRGLDLLLSEKTGLPVTVAEDPLSAVANGTGAVLNDLNWVLKNT